LFLSLAVRGGFVVQASEPEVSPISPRKKGLLVRQLVNLQLARADAEHDVLEQVDTYIDLDDQVSAEAALYRHLVYMASRVQGQKPREGLGDMPWINDYVLLVYKHGNQYEALLRYRP